MATFLPSIKTLQGYTSSFAKRNAQGPPSPPVPADASAAAGGVARLSVPHSLCVQLLVEGNVSSFQEFFHLTHRHCSEPPAVAKDASASLDDSQRAESKQPAFEEKALLPAGTQAPSEPVIDPETGEEADVALRKYKVDTLLLFKELLTTVEKCQREGNSLAIYNAQKHVATYFQDLGLPTLAIRYHQAALETARRVVDGHNTEIEASSNLGGALETQGELSHAVNCYEKSRTLAKAVEYMAEEQASTRRLLNALIKIAEDLERNSSYEKAMAFYQQCQGVISESFPDDHSALGDLHFRIGRTLFQRGEYSEAIQYYESFLKCSKIISDERNQALAHAGLSGCYERLNDLKLAISHLVSFSQLAEGMGQRRAQAEAQHRLGLLYGKMGTWDKASESLESLYELISALYVEGAQATEAADGIEEDAKQPRAEDSLSLQPAVNALAVGQAAGVNIATVQALLGIARMQAQAAMYLHVVAEAGPKEMTTLLRWKTSM